MSATWLEPFTNRTSNSYMNTEDFNRIEGNTQYLTEKLNEFLFSVQTQTKTEWDMFEIPLKSDLKRICDNITKIKTSYYEPTGFEDLSYLEDKTSLDYIDADRMERNLMLLKRLLDCMVAGFKQPSFKSGTKKQGQLYFSIRRTQ